MARGACAKEAIIKEVLKHFPGAFLNGKELRIPYMENGEEVQIKIGLTCAKENVIPPGGSVINKNKISDPENEPSIPPNADMGEYMTKPSPEEKERVKELVKVLGIE